MLDTAALTAAVETLQLYCEQVRHVMVARGYDRGHCNIDICLGGYLTASVWVFDTTDGPCEDFRARDHANPFAAALAYAEARPIHPTPTDFAAAIGIAPDGALLAAELRP